ncbi:MAG: Tfx family DNA-binding protein [Methermicoccaceae archaeon]
MQWETFITPRQLEVLKLRATGLTQEEVADRIGTTKQNVSTLERKAKQNIERARRTVMLAKLLAAPVWLEARVGDDIEKLSFDVYQSCDEKKIHIVHDRLELLSLIRGKAGEKVRHRLVVSPFELGITKDGELLIGSF